MSVAQPEQLEKKEEPKTESDFVELPKELGSGQVRRSALEAYEQWENLAKEANEGRSFFKKVFLIDKRSAMDFAREEANTEDKERTQESEKKSKLNEEKETFIRFLSESFDNIFFDAGDSPYLDGFQKLVFEDHIDTIFSEDRAGRISALICKKFLNSVYEEESKNKVRAFSMPIGRLESYEYTKRNREDVDFVASKISKLIDKNILGANILYVTDYVSSCGSVKRFSDGVEKALAEKNDISVPVRSVWDDLTEDSSVGYKNGDTEFNLLTTGFYSLITNGTDGHPPTKGQFYVPHSRRIPVFEHIRSGGLGDENDHLYANFSGISRIRNRISRNHLSKDQLEARQEVIDKVSKHLLERYHEWKVQKKDLTEANN